MTQISFPGIGIDTFEVDNVAFTIGDGFAVYWYGIIITLGIISAFIYTFYRAKNEMINQDHLIDVGLWTVILGVIGARLYYVLTSLEDFIPEPFSFGEFMKNVFNIRGGGLAIYGGIICGAAGVIIASFIKKINTLKLVDSVAPGVMIAQAIGRWGNFVNGEAHGGIVSEGHPLHFLRMGLYPNEDSIFSMVYYHPTFLYESLWNICGFILINILYKKKKFNGQIACMYLAWYGFGRFFIEGLRTDSLYVGPFRISQVVGAACFIIFGSLLVWGLIYSKKFNNPDAELNKFDKLLKPEVVQDPDRFYSKWFKKNNKPAKEAIKNGKNN
ncbi:MAG: prolipoprotein diacylglyceryl transferase [Ruminococcaceae bacterium]|nr:prolipoprotein diacylglyceryl transferase [Oscillospiraceae bacterium]